MRDKLGLLLETVLVVTLWTTGGVTALAQDVFHVTGVSADGGAWFEDAEGVRAKLGTRDTDMREIEEGAAGVVHVLSDQQLMLVTDSGAVLIVLGPAKLACGPGDGKTHVMLDDGKLVVASAWPEEGATPLVISTPADETGVRAIEAAAAPGCCYFRRSGQQVQAAYLSDGDLPPTMALTVNGKASSIKSGDLLTVDGPAVRVEPAAQWLTAERFDTRWDVNLGIASAQAARPALEMALFSNITSWDVFGGKEYVTSRLEAGRFRPEIRQIVTTVTTPQRPAAAVSGVPETRGFPAANEVPLLSPAALSVVNPAEDVTAIILNIQARTLLTQTGSRGLGFGGLSQLAIPGLSRSGTPTVGPAGLGAQR
jgi:hypothetical protein